MPPRRGVEMSCKRCPHHVRHGFAGDNNQLEFGDYCGLKIKQQDRELGLAAEKAGVVKKNAKTIIERKGAEAKPARPKKYSKKLMCEKVPFDLSFEYRGCEVYIYTFKAVSVKNDVVPTRDFEFSDVFTGGPSLAEMELL
jgi:hypothetical protein